MKVAVIGGGFTGLTAALELLEKGYSVTVFESQDYWGGLAASFEVLPGVFIERFYHHLFTNDTVILSLCRKLGISGRLKIISGKTSHLYGNKIYPLDGPLAVMKFSPLGFFDRLRFGVITLYLKLQRSGNKFSDVTAADWLRKNYGEKSYQIVWEPLLRGKFSDYFDKISMAWFWARVKKRTAKLIYPEGGFQVIIDRLLEEIRRQGGDLVSGVRAGDFRESLAAGWEFKVFDKDGNFRENCLFDKLVVTTSIKTYIKMFPNLPKKYSGDLSLINYLNAQVLILVLSKRLSRHYWINIGETSYPFLVVGEQSNLLGLDYYLGRSIVYLGNYLADGDRRLGMNSDQLIELHIPYLKKINPEFDKAWIEEAFTFVGPFSQPVVDLSYRRRIPSFETPFKNLYLATMAQVYPWDRGINFAVKLAEDLVKECF